MKKYASPENKPNEFVDLPLHDMYKIVHGLTSLERSDHIAIIDELITRVKEKDQLLAARDRELTRPTMAEFLRDSRA